MACVPWRSTALPAAGADPRAAACGGAGTLRSQAEDSGPPTHRSQRQGDSRGQRGRRRVAASIADVAGADAVPSSRRAARHGAAAGRSSLPPTCARPKRSGRPCHGRPFEDPAWVEALGRRLRPASTSTPWTPTSPGRAGCPGRGASRSTPTVDLPRTPCTCCSGSTPTSTTTCRRPSWRSSRRRLRGPRPRRPSPSRPRAHRRRARDAGRRGGPPAREALRPHRFSTALCSPLNRAELQALPARGAQKVWHNTLELQQARLARPRRPRRARGSELELLSAARVADLLRPGQVLLRLAVAGFGVVLPPRGLDRPARRPGVSPRKPRRSVSTASSTSHSIVAGPTTSSVHDHPGRSEADHGGESRTCSRSIATTRRSSRSSTSRSTWTRNALVCGGCGVDPDAACLQPLRQQHRPLVVLGHPRAARGRDRAGPRRRTASG